MIVENQEKYISNIHSIILGHLIKKICFVYSIFRLIIYITQLVKHWKHFKFKLGRDTYGTISKIKEKIKIWMICKLKQSGQFIMVLYNVIVLRFFWRKHMSGGDKICVTRF